MYLTFYIPPPYTAQYTLPFGVRVFRHLFLLLLAAPVSRHQSYTRCRPRSLPPRSCSRTSPREMAHGLRKSMLLLLLLPPPPHHLPPGRTTTSFGPIPKSRTGRDDRPSSRPIPRCASSVPSSGKGGVGRVGSGADGKNRCSNSADPSHGQFRSFSPSSASRSVVRTRSATHPSSRGPSCSRHT